MREVVEALAPLSAGRARPARRRPGAGSLGGLSRIGCEVQVDEEPFLDGYAQVIGGLAAAECRGAAGPDAGLRKAAGGAGGPVPWRSPTTSQTGRAGAAQPHAATTWNVVASCGDPGPSGPSWSLPTTTPPPRGRSSTSMTQVWLGETLPRHHRTDRHLTAAVVGDAERAATGRSGAARGSAGLIRAGLRVAAGDRGLCRYRPPSRCAPERTTT